MKSLPPTNAGSLGLFKRCDLRLVPLLAALVLLFAAQVLGSHYRRNSDRPSMVPRLTFWRGYKHQIRLLPER